jgi:VWFA-related protein
MCSAILKPAWTTLIVASLLASMMAAQPQTDDNRVTLDVTRVNLIVTVVDKKGRYVSTLQKEDFRINEDDKAQNILQFRSETDLPLRLFMLIDTSTSVRDRFKFIQEAAVSFLESTLRPGRDKALLVSFDTVVEALGEFSDSPHSLAALIRELRAGRGTAMYDAIDFACRMKIVDSDGAQDYRRVIVILSDGDDTQSRYTRSYAVEMAHKTNTVIYTVSTAMGLQLGTTGTRVLMNLAEETGGRALFPLAAKELNRSFKELSTELRNQYSIIYRPESLLNDGRFHPIKIDIRDRKDLHVRARKGYYAPVH